MLGFAEWTASEHRAVVMDMSDDASWTRLASDYTPDGHDAVLLRVFEIAKEHGVVCIVKEPRYIDQDWRSQLAQFYTGSFRRLAWAILPSFSPNSTARSMSGFCMR